MKFNTVIFDLDGTLLDTLADIANSVNYALEKNNLPTHSVEKTKTFIGAGIEHLINAALPENSSNEVLNAVLQDYTVHYALHKNDNTKPFDGVFELLDALHNKGITCAILSNKPDKATKALASELFSKTISYAKGQTNDMPVKPCADGVFHILEILEKKSSECIFVGDSDIDIQTGKNAKMYTVGVSWGFRSVKELEANGADKIAYSTDDILEIFN